MAKIIHYESIKTGVQGKLSEEQFAELKKHGGRFKIISTTDATKAKTPAEVEKSK